MMLPLCVDLDGTLVKTDVLFESAAAALKAQPLLAFALPFWLLRGRAALKSELARRAEQRERTGARQAKQVEPGRDPVRDRVQGGGCRVIDRHRYPGGQEYLGDAAPHQAGSNDRDARLAAALLGGCVHAAV